jgi:hypothetical protein
MMTITDEEPIFECNGVAIDLTSECEFDVSDTGDILEIRLYEIIVQYRLIKRGKVLKLNPGSGPSSVLFDMLAKPLEKRHARAIADHVRESRPQVAPDTPPIYIGNLNGVVV